MSQFERTEDGAWKDLRGDRLSAFASGPLKTHESKAFALHLMQYGTQQDFSNWIGNHSQPCLSACKMLFDAPDFAKVWLIDQLEINLHLDPTSASYVHHNVLIHLMKHHSTLNQDLSLPALEVLDHIKFDAIHPSDRAAAFNVLLQAKLFDRIEAHWNIFEQTVREKPRTFLPFTAFMGWDLHDKLDVTPEEPLQYFIGCCAGGLLHRVKQYPAQPSKVIEIGQALVQTAYSNKDKPKIMAEILEYLFDTYPNQPWYKTVETLATLVVYAPAPYPQKIIDHFSQNAPDILKQQAEFLACHAIYNKKHKLLDVLFPYVDPSDHYKLFDNALINKRKLALKTLLSKCTENNTGHESFFKALDGGGSKRNSWANEVYAAYQKDVLNSKLQTPQDVVHRARNKKI